MEKIPPSKVVMDEALKLSEEILNNLEQQDISLSSIALKALRLARLLNDFLYMDIFRFETSGYNTEFDQYSNVGYWALGEIAGRKFENKKKIDVIYTSSIGELEQECEFGNVSIEAAKDPDISLSSSNPRQYVLAKQGNIRERITIRENIRRARKRLESRKSFIYDYALKINSQLKFSNTAMDIFTRLRERIDIEIDLVLSDSKNKFIAIYEYLNSSNPENWTNAAHTCRMLIKDLADQIYPPREPKIVNVDGKDKEILLGNNEFKNRITNYVRENNDSKSFQLIFDANINLLESLLDATLNSAHKGSHTDISTKDEADRIVLQTYIIIGDILKIYMESQEK